VRDPIGRRWAGHQPGDRDATNHPHQLLGGAGDGVLERGAAAGDRDEALITRARRAIGDGGGHERAQVERDTAGAQQRLLHLRQVAVEDLAAA
jgi:hypothetical protein